MTTSSSIRHRAYKIDDEDFQHMKGWLQSQHLPTPKQQLVLPNHPHATIYLADFDAIPKS
ncbi:hypothetical protein [Lysinibacillus sphaericus]|uniref:hypothetical protein n=1 Tax=Lysinibacillus TaxID=400634 RepID=UPI0003A2519E|nr:hypothetical protein [Lysinibacillus sphaericus]